MDLESKTSSTLCKNEAFQAIQQENKDNKNLKQIQINDIEFDNYNKIYC